MPAFRIVEVLNVVNTSALAPSLGQYILHALHSLFNGKKTLSIATLLPNVNLRLRTTPARPSKHLTRCP